MDKRGRIGWGWIESRKVDWGRIGRGRIGRNGRLEMDREWKDWLGRM